MHKKERFNILMCLENVEKKMQNLLLMVPHLNKGVSFFLMPSFFSRGPQPDSGAISAGDKEIVGELLIDNS